MKRAQISQEIRLMRFTEIYDRWRVRRLTQEEAAQLLGVHERTFRRYCRKHETEGIAGLYDRRLDKEAHNMAPVDEVMAMLSLFQTRYPNFTVAHFYDKYRDDHGGQRSYNWVKEAKAPLKTRPTYPQGPQAYTSHQSSPDLWTCG